MVFSVELILVSFILVMLYFILFDQHMGFYRRKPLCIAYKVAKNITHRLSILERNEIDKIVDRFDFKLPFPKGALCTNSILLNSQLYILFIFWKKSKEFFLPHSYFRN